MGTIKAKRLDGKYGCSHKDLYEVVRIAHDLFMEKIVRFTAVSSFYTEEWAENLLADMFAAKAMPEEQERSDQHETLRVNLIPVGQSCCINWKLLEIHITKSFPVEQHKTKLEAAGKEYYTRALRKDWESVSLMMQMASNFMDENLALLTAAGMPASFPDNFSTLTIDFDNKYAEFKEIEIKTEEAREAKIAANNALFETLMGMLKDGQKIFRNEPAVREQFVFSRLLADIGNGKKTIPPVPAIKIKTNGGPVNFGARLLGLLKILWGDNTSAEFIGDPAATNFIDKIYILQKNYTIIVTEKVGEIIELHINNSNLIYIKLYKRMKKLEQFIAQGNLFPTKVVDDILITINSYDTSGSGRIINLLGSEPPSVAGLQAKAELESRGWIVLVSN